MYSQIAANKRKSVGMMVFFSIFVALVAYVAGLQIGGDSFAPFAILGAFIYVVISYYASSRVAMSLAGATEIQKKDNPRLYRIVENLAITEGVPTPRVFIIHDPAPNACATGRNPQTAMVAVTTGLLDIMEDVELEGVLAHELGHVKNYDIRVSMVAFAMVGVIGLISDMTLRAMFWGGGDNDNDNNNNGSALMIVGIVAVVLAPIIAAMIQLAISRRREYLADASGALTTRYPEGLASALQKIGQAGSVTKRQSSSTAHLYFANPLKKASFSNLFSTHPPIEERIARLKEMETSL